MTVEITVPGSKSITQRALITAALAKGDSVITSALESDDTSLLRDGLRHLGVVIDDSSEGWTVHGTSGRLKKSRKPIYMGNNGTGIRFLISVAAMVKGVTTLIGSKRMEERPAAPLLEALSQLGVKAKSLKGTGCPPIEVESQGLSGGAVHLSASISSQFLSSLLLAAPYAAEPVTIILDGGLVSKPYVDITTRVMHDFGIDVRVEGNIFSVPVGCYHGINYQIEADASSASYFLAAAAVTGRSVLVTNMPEKPIQGDAYFADILGMMGCKVNRTGSGTLVKGPDSNNLRAIDIDMGRWPDVVPTLAAVAAFANGKTRITNVAHLRIKETDRIKAVVTELRRIGVDARELDDGLTVDGPCTSLSPAVIHTYDDHRIAMSLAVAGLRIPGLDFEDRSVVTKSFPDFWERWSKFTKELAKDTGT